MHCGYVKLWRGLMDDPMWLAEPFSRGQAWVDLITMAYHSDGIARVRGVRVDVKRGQVAMSEQAMSTRWKWSRNKVRRFLAEISSKTEQKIEQQKNNVTTLITILNYEKYQGNGTADETTSDTANDTANDTAPYKEKNGKNVKNIKTPISPLQGEQVQGELFLECKPHRNGVPYEEIRKLYNETMVDLPECIEMTPLRKRNLKKCWNQQPGRTDTMEFWEWFFDIVKDSDFLMGRTTPKPFTGCTLEWLTKYANFIKVRERTY